jgi:DNA-binding IclR family transcriptional regulator
MSENGGIVVRYAIVLDVLAAAPFGLTHSEIVAETGLPQGTVHRLVKALHGIGYVAQIDGRKVYTLGPRLMRLLHAGVAPVAVATLLRPALDDLVVRFKETAFVAKLVGKTVESVAMVVPTGETQSYVQPGRAMSFHAAASAKAILAFQSRAFIAGVMAEPRTEFSSSTRAQRAEVLEDLELVRVRGYAVCDGELDPGVLSYACPVNLSGAGILYSVGIVGLSQRLASIPSDEIVAALRAVADDIADRLGARLPETMAVEIPADERSVSG